MKGFFSLLNQLTKILLKVQVSNNRQNEKEQTEKKKDFYKNENQHQNSNTTPTYNHPSRNEYNLKSISLYTKEKFNELLINGNYEISTPLMIRNQIRIEELEKYILLNKKRYFEKIAILYGNNFNLSLISLQQKL